MDFEDLHVSELELTRRPARPRTRSFAAGNLPATQPVFERYAKWVEEFLAAKGQPEKSRAASMPARPAITPSSSGRTGHLPVVALVTFRGNHVVPQNVLHEAIAGAAIGTPYTEDRFRDILNSVHPPDL